MSALDGTPLTRDTGIDLAKRLVLFSISHGTPCAFEVVQTRTKIEVQPAGMHALFKSHKLLHTEPLPQGVAA